MKTLETLMEEIKGSEEMKKEFLALNSKEAMDAFFKKHDCEAVTEDFAAYVQAELEKLRAEQAEEGEISDDAAEKVSGGEWTWGRDLINYFFGCREGLDMMDDAVHDFFTQTLQDAASSTGGFTKSDHPVTPTGKHMRTRIEASPIPTANPSPKKRAR